MLKKYKPIVIVSGEPESTFLEIFIKALKYKNFKSPLILICSLNLIKNEIKRLKFKKKVKLLNVKNLNSTKIDNDCINLINVSFDNQKKNKSKYIETSFNLAFKLIKEKFTNKFINGPINKKDFLKKKFLGITEFVSKKFDKKKN
jgi:4-hydroxy-L-threonine phosphate dehydrogenase PdxA